MSTDKDPLPFWFMQWANDQQGDTNPPFPLDSEECKAWDLGYDQGQIQGAVAAFYKLSQSPPGLPWIKADVLPKMFVNVIAATNKGHYIKTCVDASGGFDRFELEAYEGEFITHYMYLSAPAPASNNPTCSISTQGEQIAKLLAENKEYKADYEKCVRNLLDAYKVVSGLLPANSRWQEKYIKQRDNLTAMIEVDLQKSKRLDAVEKEMGDYRNKLVELKLYLDQEGYAQRVRWIKEVLAKYPSPTQNPDK